MSDNKYYCNIYIVMHDINCATLLTARQHSLLCRALSDHSHNDRLIGSLFALSIW